MLTGARAGLPVEGNSWRSLLTRSGSVASLATCGRILDAKADAYEGTPTGQPDSGGTDRATMRRYTILLDPDPEATQRRNRRGGYVSGIATMKDLSLVGAGSCRRTSSSGRWTIAAGRRLLRGGNEALPGLLTGAEWSFLARPWPPRSGHNMDGYHAHVTRSPGRSPS